MLLGYAGWGPGQLVEGMQRDSWLRADFEPALLWDVMMEKRWDHIYERLGIDPAAFLNVPGGARA